MSETNYRMHFPKPEALSGQTCTLLLGTDQHIEEGTINQEKRVGVTPVQAKALIDWLRSLGITLNFYFVEGAGVSAEYSDDEYIKIGGMGVKEDDLKGLKPPDVFHALKEPCSYEAEIRGPFLRIGALHTGKFTEQSGLAQLLSRQNFSAIFDGSALGGYAYRFNGSYPIPLRSSMSVFAGEITADMILANTNAANEKIVISGGGVVGTSCLRKIMNKNDGHIVEILVVDQDPKTCERLHQEFDQNRTVKIKRGHMLEDADIFGASALVLGAFVPGLPAPKVVQVSQIAKMVNDSIVVDVAIDEGGSISSPQSDLAESIAREIEGFGKNILYIADTHMPRKHAHVASDAHGKAVLPYLATILYLVAREGSSINAAKYILNNFTTNPGDYFASLISDLKQGIAISGPSPVSVWTQVVKDKDPLAQFLTRRKIPYIMQ